MKSKQLLKVWKLNPMKKSIRICINDDQIIIHTLHIYRSTKYQVFSQIYLLMKQTYLLAFLTLLTGTKRKK